MASLIADLAAELAALETKRGKLQAEYIDAQRVALEGAIHCLPIADARDALVVVAMMAGRMNRQLGSEIGGSDDGRALNQLLPWLEQLADVTVDGLGLGERVERLREARIPGLKAQGGVHAH